MVSTRMCARVAACTVDGYGAQPSKTKAPCPSRCKAADVQGKAFADVLSGEHQPVRRMAGGDRAVIDDGSAHTEVRRVDRLHDTGERVVALLLMSMVWRFTVHGQAQRARYRNSASFCCANAAGDRLLHLGQSDTTSTW